MKALKLLPAFSGLLALLSACNGPSQMHGTLKVATPFKVKAITGNVITVPVKELPTTLKLTSDGAQAWIKFPDASLVFNIPQVKEDSVGNVNITPAKLKQEFGIQGKITPKRSKFDRVVSKQCVSGHNESVECNWKDVCETDADGNESCSYQNVCETVYDPIYGSMEVREVGYQDTKLMDVSVVKGAAAVASFKGTYYYSERITGSQEVSGCY
jgi:hypothetical protein